MIGAARIRRSATVAMLLLGAALVGALIAPQSVLAQSFAIRQVAIDAQVSSDGALTIAEKRTVEFDGDFSRVFWNLDKSGSEGIEIVGVTDDSGTAYEETTDASGIDDSSRRVPGTYLVQDVGAQVTVHIFHRSSDEQRSFTLNYRALGAAKRWADTGELYWTLLGDETAVSTDEFRARVAVAGVTAKSQMKAWAHGPLTGNVAIEEDGVVTLEADRVPANTFVEVRMAFPAEALSAATPSSEARLQQILSEEQQAADEANSQRRAARITVWVWIVLPSLLSLGALALGIWAFVRFGREHRGEFQGQYFREDPRPDLHPAVVGALWRFGKVEDTDIAATLMDLADKGVVRMAPQTVEKGGIAGMFGGTTQTFTLERIAGTDDKVGPLDKQLLDILFGTVGGGRSVITLTEIEAYAKANPQTFTNEMKAWKDAASAQAETMGFFEGESQGWQIGIFILAVFIVAVSIFGVTQSGSGWPLVVAVPVGIILFVLGIFMRRRSQAGNELYRTYRAVRDYLKDFSRLHEAPPASVVLWNRFLVLAVVFGIAEQVIEQLRVSLPEVVKDPGFQTSYWWVYAGAYGHSPVGALSQSFVSAASVAHSQMSSGSGGGGGFSGGGGFGGGGGGFGAD